MSKIKIGEHIKIIPGFPFNSALFNIDGEGLPLIRIRDLLTSKIETFYKGEYPKEYIIEEGDILIGMDGDFHIVKWKNKTKALLNQRIMKVAQKEGAKINIDYFYYFLYPFLSDVWEKTTATTVKHLSTYDVSETEAEFPDFEIQTKIARILTTADAVIEKNQAAIAKYKAIKQGMLQDLFTRGIDLNTNKLRPRYQDAPELYKESKLGMIPREWDCDSIDNLTDKVGSGVTPTGGSEVYKSQGILFLRSQNILYGKLSLNDVAFIPEEIDEIMENSRVKPFDVLLNITGASIGRCAFFPEELVNANVNQHVCIIRFKTPSKSRAVFASEYLNTDFGQRQMYKVMAVGNREGLNYQQIKAFNFPEIKNPKEIEKISTIIENLNNKLQTEQTYLQKMQSLKKGLMEDLLSGRKQVKIKEEVNA